ncbi:MAG: orotidine 5'-phosphate decarboxylase / HUMPS family protein [Candidatus Micrarchaeales archaeon]|jgi:3-hexulose-6-phosphate synthase/6-phospho-3-hexuloisomerase
MFNQKPILQVALDFEHLTDAERIARILQKELADVEYLCEAGTPLIKNEGLKIVIPRLRGIVGTETKISADLKTLDTGAFEVELAYRSGADMVGIAGVAEEETIDAALAKAKNLKMTAIVDSLGIMNIDGRLEAIEEKISSYIKEGGDAVLEYHIPIDIQTKARDFTQVREMHERSHIPIAVAGGLDEHTIPEILDYGASICIVGGTITRPKKGTPEEAIRKIKKIIYQ